MSGSTNARVVLQNCNQSPYIVFNALITPAVGPEFVQAQVEPQNSPLGVTFTTFSGVITETSFRIQAPLSSPSGTAAFSNPVAPVANGLYLLDCVANPNPAVPLLLRAISVALGTIQFAVGTCALLGFTNFRAQFTVGGLLQTVPLTPLTPVAIPVGATFVRVVAADGLGNDVFTSPQAVTATGGGLYAVNCESGTLALAAGVTAPPPNPPIPPTPVPTPVTSVVIIKRTRCCDRRRC